MSEDEVYQLATNIGGAGLHITERNDANVIHNSASLKLNIVKKVVGTGITKCFTPLLLVRILNIIS